VLIRALPAVRCLPRGTVRELVSLLTPLDLPAGSTIGRRGVCARELVVVLDGAVDAVVEGDLVRRYGPGDWLAPLDVIERRRRTTDFVTTVATVVGVAGPREWPWVVWLLPELAHPSEPEPRDAPPPVETAVPRVEDALRRTRALGV
jgi:hypothetical protein